MILMAIDHVRVYAGIPPGGTTAGLFFTRWVTHYCAPAFIFLAGTSAYLYARKRNVSGSALSKFLLTRGIWLVFLELTFLRVAWAFNFDFANYNMAGVIWVIGWCMILMAALVRLPLAAVGIFGVVVILAHNIADAFMGQLIEWVSTTSGTGWAKILYLGFYGGPIQFGANGPSLIVLYSIVPWIGVMAAGYAFGSVVRMEPARRNRICLQIGLGAIAGFLVLRGFDLYGDPHPWREQMTPDGGGMPALLAFLNTTKYPASLLFLAMTLGPTLALIPLLEHARGAVARAITVFGRVPFLYYMLHIPLIHVLALVVSWIREGAVNPWLFMNLPLGDMVPPDGYAWSLPLMYLVFVVVVAILYPVCRWFVGVKSRRSDWWLSYL